MSVRNYKYPCIQCKTKPVKSNQKGIQCNTCKKWVHAKCTDLTNAQYDILKADEDLPFFCLICKPRSNYADLIFDQPNVANNVPLLDRTITIVDNASSTLSSDVDFSFHSTGLELSVVLLGEGKKLNYPFGTAKFHFHSLFNDES